ncbi:MAG: mannose-1-phosphate guanylyltransferase [Chloroflexi bacterium]|nr:mannose-1-phosphate guanylyltransferase [Chloroflexota bacterium]
MKIIIFAGGSGRRLWPLSRQKSPKQFEPILGSRSTLQLGVERVLDVYGAANIFISTNERYVDLVRQQLPQLPPQNIIGEPARRDLAAAVGLALTHLAHQTDSPDEPVAILWGDNYMSQVDTFRSVLAAAETLLRQRKAAILFVGETPRFANENLGWIGLGERLGEVGERPYYRFASLSYRPPLDHCQQMFAEKTHVWNTGYFVTTIGFVQQQYQQQQPKIWQQLTEIGQRIGHADYLAVLRHVYPQIESLSFDDAILQYIAPEEAAVLHGSMGWSDPGTLYALKEALNPDPTANVTEGLVLTKQASDCLVYNQQAGKLVAVIGVEGLVVVNMDDALLVVHKDQIPLVKALVDGLDGTELEKYS